MRSSFQHKLTEFAACLQQQPEAAGPGTWKEAGKSKQPLSVSQHWSLGHFIAVALVYCLARFDAV